MNIIYKYTLTGEGDIISAKRFLSAQIQDGKICVWALQGEEEKQYNVYIIGTGWPAQLEEDIYIGTVQQGRYVWHVFAEEI